MIAAGRSELVPLTARLAALQAVRLGLAGVVLVALAGAGPQLDRPGSAVVVVSLAFVAFTAVVELVRRRAGRRALMAVSWLLTLDGIYVAFVLDATGGHQSPLVFLVYLHVVAVTLLASFRAGLRLAIWHALLLVVAEVAILVPDPGESSVDLVALGLTIAAFPVVAAGAAACASLNERALRQGRLDLGALLALSNELERSGTVDEVVATGVAHLRGRVNMEGAGIVVYDRTTWTGACDPGGGAVGVGVKGGVDQVVQAAWDRGVPQLVAELDEHRDPMLWRLFPEAFNVLVVPMVAEASPLGVVVAKWGGRRGAQIPTSAVSVLVQSAAQISLALGNALLLAEVERLATSDALTGLANRRALEEVLVREVARARRTRQPLSLAIIDVDRFKSVNDTHGHLFGDEVLRQLGIELARACRVGNTVARWGGEEFVAVFPGCSQRDAVMAAERLRRVAERVTATDVTASAGVATLPLDAHDADSLLGAADTALYEAKQAGRDRTVPLGLVPDERPWPSLTSP